MTKLQSEIEMTNPVDSKVSPSSRSARTVCLYIMQKRGYETLKGLLEVVPPNTIERVVSANDKTVKENYFDEIRTLCGVHGIEFHERTACPAVTSSISFALGWRWLISDSTGLIVMHDSLLPKYRGFAPIVSMLLDGQKSLGVTAFWAVDEFDAGDIIAKKSVDVVYPIKIREAIDLVAPLFKELAVSIVQQYLEGGTIESVPQDHTDASFSLWRDELDYRINWSRDAEYIKRFVDAVGEPYQGAYTFIGQKKVRVLDGYVVDDERDIHDRTSHIGKVISMTEGCPVVVCGSGLFAVSALLDETGTNILPLKKFRTRFGSQVWT